jgi:hypothetical protein
MVVGFFLEKKGGAKLTILRIRMGYGWVKMTCLTPFSTIFQLYGGG